MPLDPVQFPIGTIPGMVFSDGSGPLTEADLVGVFKADADRMVAAFRALPAPPIVSQNILYLEANGQRILIDTGIGSIDRNESGQLLDGLRAAAIAPDTIDTIILTHFHFDHIGGLRAADGLRAFPNARLIAPHPEYDYWLSDAYLATADPERAAVLRGTFDAYADRLTLADENAQIVPGVRYVPAFGHTPGHCAVLIESAGKRLLHIGDTVHSALQFDRVDAIPVFDVQPEAAIATRRAIIERVESEQLLMLAYHFPFPGLGHITRRGDHHEWVPLVVEK